MGGKRPRDFRAIPQEVLAKAQKAKQKHKKQSKAKRERESFFSKSFLF
jgi:hypothetical protein